MSSPTNALSDPQIRAELSVPPHLVPSFLFGALYGSTGYVFTGNGSATVATFQPASGGGGGGVSVVGTFSSPSIANGASISGSTITFGAADLTNPGMVSTGSQQLAGEKILKSYFTATGASTGVGGQILLGADNTQGPYIVSSTDSSGNATTAGAAVKTRYGAAGFFIQSGDAPGLGLGRTFTSRFVVTSDVTIPTGTKLVTDNVTGQNDTDLEIKAVPFSVRGPNVLVHGGDTGGFNGGATTIRGGNTVAAGNAGPVNIAGGFASSTGSQGVINLLTNNVIRWFIDALGILNNATSGNESTGAGIALLSTNCPAVTPAAPYTWITLKTSDGSTVYLPVWK